MAINIKKFETDNLAREVAKRTANRDQLYEILKRVDALPLLDPRTEDEILGYI
ncbi:MAG TPA: hypothetical protein VGJ51_04105 [Candidatus Angelobacter sp.]